jgi:ABC-type polar amino acid transport system ATPase subunit
MPFAYHLDREIRQNVLEVLKLLAKDEDTCRILIRHLMQASDIADEIYDALQVISARGGLRVFHVPDNDLPGKRTDTTMEHIEVEEWHYKLV